MHRFTKEMKDSSAGLLAAAFIGIVPGYISRSVAGSYDNEAIAIFLLMITFFLWIRALKIGSALFGTLAAVFYFYMVAAWGVFYFSIRIRNRLTQNRRLCFHHEHDSPSCPRPYSHGQVFKSIICSIFILVCYWNAR